MKLLVGRYAVYAGVLAAFIAGFALACVLQPAPAVAKAGLDDLLGSAAKVVGVAVLVDKFGGQLNKAINSVMDQNDVSTKSSSKVVTIITPLGNKHIGAAQVVGEEDAVAKVGAVAQLETSFMDKLFRIKVLIPIEGKDATHLRRVPGVGVSAVIDVKI